MSILQILLCITPSLACAATVARSPFPPLSLFPLSFTTFSLLKILFQKSFAGTFANTTMHWLLLLWERSLTISSIMVEVLIALSFMGKSFIKLDPFCQGKTLVQLLLSSTSMILTALNHCMQSPYHSFLDCSTMSTLQDMLYQSHHPAIDQYEQALELTRNMDQD